MSCVLNSINVVIMGGSDRSKKGELFIFDIATGFFEIGSLLTLEQKWQNLDKIRILMGDEVSKRTQQAFDVGLRHITWNYGEC